MPHHPFPIARKAWVAKTISSLFNSIAPTSTSILSRSRNSSGTSNLDTTLCGSMQSS